MTTNDRTLVTDQMVDRFLSWPLPASVCSDGCVTDRDYPHPRCGTNLLTADEAKQMLEYVLQAEDGPAGAAPLTAQSLPLPTEPLERSIVWPQAEIDGCETVWGLGDIDRAMQNMGMEIARLRAHADDLARKLAEVVEAAERNFQMFVSVDQYAKEMKAGKDDAERKLAAAEKDAGRYRWLRATNSWACCFADTHSTVGGMVYRAGSRYMRERLDAAIDAMLPPAPSEGNVTEPHSRGTGEDCWFCENTGCDPQLEPSIVPVCCGRSLANGECCGNPEPSPQPHQCRVCALLAELRGARHDIEAYRGALGHSVPGDHDGRLTNGAIPICGLCNAKEQRADDAERRLTYIVNRAFRSQGGGFGASDREPYHWKLPTLPDAQTVEAAIDSALAASTKDGG